jgi:hypothetical protein
LLQCAPPAKADRVTGKERFGRWLNFEGRGHPECDRLREAYREVCCPSDIAWRRLVLVEGPKRIDQLADGMRAWEE